MREDDSGQVSIEYRGVPLPARAFPRDGRVDQGAIVDNKILGHTLAIIRGMQQERDAERLRTGRFTLREEDHLRKAMGIAGLPHRRADDKTVLPAAPTRAAALDHAAEADNCTLQSAGHF